MPHGADQDTYLVLDDFGRVGRSWREADVERSDRNTLIRELVDGLFRDPVRIVAFNTAEGRSRDVTVHCRRAATTLRRVRRGTAIDTRLHGYEPALIRLPADHR